MYDPANDVAAEINKNGGKAAGMLCNVTKEEALSNLVQETVGNWRVAPAFRSA